MLFSKKARRGTVEGWTDGLRDCAIGRGRGTRDNVGLLIDGCTVTAPCAVTKA
jgi:hypothetical protein